MKRICLSLLAFIISPVFAQNEKITLKVGVYENKPKIYKDRTGKITGFEIDLLNYIAEKEKWQIHYVWNTWNREYEMLKQGKLDVLLDMGYSKERAKLFQFNNESILVNWARVYSSRNQDAENFLALKGKKIAVMKNSIHTEGEYGIKRILKSFNLPCEYIEVSNYRKVFELLDKGRADFGVVNRTFGDANEKKFRVHRTPIIFNPVEVRFAFPKNSTLAPLLIKKVDYHLGNLKNNPNSLYYALLEKYLGPSIAKPVLPKWFYKFLMVVAGFAIMILLALFISRIEVRRKTRALQFAHQEIFDRLSAALEYKDNYSHDHVRVVGETSYLIAKKLGLSEKECEIIRKAATMHDVGKIAVPDKILLKPGRLTEEEFKEIITHTKVGAKLLANGNYDEIKMAETIALYHHERWDGKGYPNGLKGEQIPLAARICKVADVFSALISERPYKKAWDVEKAVQEVIQGKGTLFDPKVVDAFLQILPQIREKLKTMGTKSCLLLT